MRRPLTDNLHQVLPALIAVIFLSAIPASGENAQDTDADNTTHKQATAGAPADGYGDDRSPPKSEAQTAEEVERLFKQANQLLMSNRAYEARKLLEHAAALNPRSAAVHCNLGLAYSNSGNLAKAVHEFAAALEIHPQMGEATLNMASCYQSNGQNELAIAWYQKFLNEHPDSKQTTQVQDIIRILKENASKPGFDPRLPDYFDCISTDGVYRWVKEKMPIKVYVDDGKNVPGYRDSFRQLLLESFDTWAKATGAKLAFVLVPTPGAADVVCTWTNDVKEVSDNGNQSERGYSKLYATNGNITAATLKVLTRSTMEGAELSDDDMKKACLHEVGHILGLQGHSPNNHDVMFFTIDTATVWPVLTRRDKNTIVRLYNDYPQIVGATPLAR